MTKPYDFTGLPEYENFDYIATARMRLGSEMERGTAIRMAIIDALEYAQNHPTEYVACNLSEQSHKPLYVPVRREMHGNDAFAMESRMQNAEIFAFAAEAVGKGDLTLVKNPSFKSVVGLAELLNPYDVKAYRKALKTDDTSSIQTALIGLHQTALKDAQQYFHRFDTIPYKPSVIENLIASALTSRGNSGIISTHGIEL